MKRILFTLVPCMASLLSGTINAQETMKENKTFAVADLSNFKSHNSNPWGLVYADAITENKAGAKYPSITYDLGGLKIAANVYTPADYDPQKLSALVVAHPNGGVKEQVAGLYSQRMAEAGYICLTFDAAYQAPARASRATRISRPTASKIFAGPPTSCCNIRAWTRSGWVFSASAEGAATR